VFRVKHTLTRSLNNKRVTAAAVIVLLLLPLPLMPDDAADQELHAPMLRSCSGELAFGRVRSAVTVADAVPAAVD